MGEKKYEKIPQTRMCVASFGIGLETLESVNMTLIIKLDKSD